MTDEVRSFPALPRGRRATGRARSWWGDAWLTALEATALDLEQLRRGRTTAARGLVGAITMSAGRVAAFVHDPDGSAYEAVVHVPVFDAETWDQVAAQVAARAGNVAALLAGDLPRELVEDVSDVGATLLPGLGDLEPECTCEGWELPCRHAAALCYQVARLLDDDPFLVLLLRGRGRAAFAGDIDALAVAGTPALAETGATEDGYPLDRAVTRLVTDAARRARAMLATGDSQRSALHLNVEDDAERWAAWYGTEE